MVIIVRNSNTFTTKNRRVRVIPMNDHLYKMLMERKEHVSCELVFHLGTRQLTKDYVSKKFKKLVRKAGLNDKLHFHSLRHTFASWLVQKGVSLYEVQTLLGHTSISVTQCYSHLQPERLHATVNHIDLPTITGENGR
jgi:site-specific recombinase XerD